MCRLYLRSVVRGRVCETFSVERHFYLLGSELTRVYIPLKFLLITINSRVLLLLNELLLCTISYKKICPYFSDHFFADIFQAKIVLEMGNFPPLITFVQVNY